VPTSSSSTALSPTPSVTTEPLSTTAANNPTPPLPGYLDTITREHATHSYDLILRTQLDPTIPLGTNKPRNNNARFRQLADQHVAQVMMDLHLNTETLTHAEHDTTLVRALAFATARPR
jgi:hypothetical protein